MLTFCKAIGKIADDWWICAGVQNSRGAEVKLFRVIGTDEVQIYLKDASPGASFRRVSHLPVWALKSREWQQYFPNGEE